ncbi:uncharacterized protein FYW49_002227 isoform 2-T2 [Xenentodon cancila]
MLDVLIIGGGPHALTLASLLSSHDPDLNSDSGPDPPRTPHHSDPHKSQPKPKTSSNRRCSGTRKKRATVGQTTEEQLGKLTKSERLTCPPLSLRVVDTYGDWTALWESQFAALNIPHLRSHTLVHTDPFNKKALQEFVLKCERSAELHSLPDRGYILDENAFFNDMRLGKKERKRLNISSTLKTSLSFSLPGTKLSVDFFKEQVERYKLGEVLVKGTVEHITPVTEEKDGEEEQEAEGESTSASEGKRDGAKKRVKYFSVHLQEGDIIKARQVVMATGPTRAQMANIPAWVRSIGESYPEQRLQHTVHLMHQLPNSTQKLREANCQKEKETFSAQGLYVLCETGQRVMVVGGGLTSAHVVSIALQQGASHVTWVMRKHLQLKQFDVGDVESLVGRYSHVEHGIKMDGQAYLRQFYNERRLHKRLAMIQQARKGGAVTPEAYIHLKPFIMNGKVELKTYCQVIDGWPCITESLRWTDECPLYLMGQYTALQVGPHAVNLAGGQAASIRIAKDLMRHQQQDNRHASDTKGGKLKTEDYIEQMQGLLWL